MYSTNSDYNNIRFNNTMLKSSSCNYSDAYILVKGRITITGAESNTRARQADERNKKVIFKNCAIFINCNSVIHSPEIDNTKDIGIVIPMYNLNIVIIIQKHLQVYGNVVYGL